MAVGERGAIWNGVARQGWASAFLPDSGLHAIVGSIYVVRAARFAPWDEGLKFLRVLHGLDPSQPLGRLSRIQKPKVPLSPIYSAQISCLECACRMKPRTFVTALAFRFSVFVSHTLHPNSSSSLTNSPVFCSVFGWVLTVCGLCLTFSSSAAVNLPPNVALGWNEEILEAIRIDRPNPPVHARNLFSVSTAMYDAWAAYDSVAVGFIYHSKHTEIQREAARREAISYAAYQILRERFALSRSALLIAPQ